MKRLVVLLLFLSAASAQHVHDLAGLFPEAERADLELSLAEYEEGSAVEMVLVTVEGEEKISSLADSFFDGVGSEGKGVLLLVDAERGEFQFRKRGVGLTDVQLFSISQNYLVPSLQGGETDGIRKTLEAVMDVLGPDGNGRTGRHLADESWVTLAAGAFLLLFLGLFAATCRGRFTEQLVSFLGSSVRLGSDWKK